GAGLANGGAASSKSLQNPKERRRLRAEKQKQIAPVKKEAEALEAAISESEKFISVEEQAMLDPVFFKSSEAPDRIRALEKRREKMDEDMLRWEKRLNELEALQNELADMDAE
ncbi:MAG: hypothetical protein JW942_02505, partial [Opitutales bacterium]|nr:hypothetical protein [Opitutales bacterium]